MDECASVEANAAEGLLRLSQETLQQDTNACHSVTSSDSTISLDDSMDIDTPDSGSTGHSAHKTSTTENHASGSLSQSGQPAQLLTTHTVERTPEESLQAYLIHQQLLAGIPRENIIPMRGQVPGIPQQPTLLRIDNNGISVPSVPPARFTGVIRPLPQSAIQTSRPAGPVPGQTVPQNNFGSPPPASPYSAGRGSWSGQQGHTCPYRQSGPSRAPRTLPHLRSKTSIGPSNTLKNLTAVQPSWASDIPRIADFAYASVNNINPCFPQQQGHVVLPNVHDLLRGAPVYSQTGRFPTTSASTTCESENAPTVPAVDLETESVSAPSSNNTEPEAIPPPVVSPEHSEQPSDTMPGSPAPPPGIDFFQVLFTRGDIGLVVIDNLDLADIIKLRPISKPFHNFIKCHESSIAIQKARQEAPEAAHAYPPVCYPSLCLKSNNSNADTSSITTTTKPSLRWAAMVTYRDRAAHEIVQTMGELGHGIPAKCAGMLKKLWFLFDIPDNKRREWTTENVNLWPDMDVFYLTFFLVNVDIYVRTKFDNQTGGLRRLAMAQPSLSFFLDVLKGRRFDTLVDMLQTFVRWKYKPEPVEAMLGAFGVEAGEIGVVQYENYGRWGERVVKFRRPDVCVLKEVQRRGLDMEQMYIDMVMVDDLSQYYNGTGHPTWDEEVRRNAELEDAPDWVRGLHMNLED